MGSFYTVQYRRVQYSTVIGQLPRVSTEDRVVSVFEPSDCLFHGVSKFSNFFLFHPSLFIQYSTEECSTVQLLASSLEYPQRIEWSQCLNSVSVCLFVPCVSSNFLIFPSFILLFLYSTVQKSAVQYSYLFIKLSLPGPLRHLFYNKIKWKVNVCTLL